MKDLENCRFEHQPFVRGKGFVVSCAQKTPGQKMHLFEDVIAFISAISYSCGQSLFPSVFDSRNYSCSTLHPSICIFVEI